MEISEDLKYKEKSIFFRETEVAFLTQFMGKELSFSYRSLFIHGQKSTGKTLVVSKVVQDFSVSHIWINCHECYTSQLILTRVVHRLSKAEEDHKKIRNVCDFINFLKNHLKDSTETTFLIFDCAEILDKECHSLIQVLINLQDFAKVNIRSVFISELDSFDYCYRNNNDVDILHFPNYSKTQLSEILCKDCPPGYSQDFYGSYINVIMRTFFTVTRNLSELRYLAEVNFEKYCEPLNQDPDEELSAMRLWKNIEPTLKEAMKYVYLREISGTKWRNHCKGEDKNKLCVNTGSNCITRELPFYSKFLLLAAYFASYNPPKSDFKHFVKNQGKQGKKKITRKVEKNRHLLGPKPFSLDRLLSIFFTIVDERVLPSALIFSQISSLVHMRLMGKVSVDEQLDSPKYKCLAELDLVCKIGKTLNIDVMGYLDDFL